MSILLPSLTPLIYKSSFDKANRTSVNGKRGIRLDKDLDILSKIKETFNCRIILTAIDTEMQCPIVTTVADILQIPAFLCIGRQICYELQQPLIKL